MLIINIGLFGFAVFRDCSPQHRSRLLVRCSSLGIMSSRTRSDSVVGSPHNLRRFVGQRSHTCDANVMPTVKFQRLCSVLLLLISSNSIQSSASFFRVSFARCASCLFSLFSLVSLPPHRFLALPTLAHSLTTATLRFSRVCPLRQLDSQPASH